MAKKRPKTPEQAKEEIASQGITIAQWARKNGLAPRPVYDVLCGRNKGRFGEGHRAAVLLGLKAGKMPRAKEEAHV